MFSYKGEGVISRQTILDAMTILNEDFQRLNPDTSETRSEFLPIAADVNVEFRLASLDPDGNCTGGIVRIEDIASLNARNNVKALSRWDPKKYFNVWVVANIESFSTGQPGGDYWIWSISFEMAQQTAPME